MRAAVLWTERARRDLLDIGDFVAGDKPGAASKLVGEILDAVERAALFPTSGRIVPETDRPDIREAILGNYRIAYQLEGSSMAILTVFESHRLLDDSFIKDTDRG